MALFHVARYQGPEATGPERAEAEAGAGSRARALLERLQSQARERQQQRELEPAEAAAQTSEVPGRRRRRPRRRPRVSGRAAGRPDTPQAKRLRAGGEDADADAGSSEEAPKERSASPEAPDSRPPETVSELPGPGQVLGGLARRKAAKVQLFLPMWLANPSCVKKNVTKDLVPIEDIPEVHPDLQKQLRARGISSYFPVQAAVIPALLENAASGFLVGRGGYQPSDLCVSAPTGSGKTLAFVIPVVQALLHRVVCHVRALVMLPTKELAQQVSKVFNIYTDATPLRVALVTGQKPLATEQESLVQKTADGFRCLADIVVATPGRLVDHINQTPGFSLQQLRFLVVDEADRMIDSMHQSWLPRVMAAALPSKGPADPCALLQRWRPQAVTAASACCPQMPLQKLLFSATLTQNPEKLQQLGLYQPRLFSTRLAHRVPKDEGTEVDRDPEGKYTFPAGLTHHYVPCSLSSKPLAIMHLVVGKNFSRALCFTNSRENSHSLISTDATARGIDVLGVELVINYDAPQYLRTYVHRVGRTARAGKTGQAFTLLLKVQERTFLRMLAEGGAPELAQHEIPSKLLQPLVPRYEEALSQLERTVKEEQKQKAA
ncbi:ATP-dependent RNA helicase DDX51 isoform X2 [Heterocephalus glaber]|uniref:ATP-dependent RNA helicase n=1 Tax=Heterocephalus glaber TaxID=10181 RepID=A0AAX6SYM6_HETGA|nr:ATP-dependent RNA helicase DDX51 isoform X2 [Heterocephalus glaber]